MIRKAYDSVVDLRVQIDRAQRQAVLRRNADRALEA